MLNIYMIDMQAKKKVGVFGYGISGKFYVFFIYFKI